ncbi:MAG: GNAT family N-acetyltransferase [Candidatus Aenigmarchaeota archaeon]|nr:GNAT family N-acetyltransferase [Candidatus Aenigmarchaeota archaeon]
MNPKFQSSVRKAMESDLKPISEIFRSESSKKPYSQKWTEQTAFEKVKELFEKGHIYIALVNGEVVGFISLTTSLWEQSKCALIEELWVKSGHQRKGIGRLLVWFAETKCKENDINSIFTISNKKSAAFKFYKKQKYKLYSNHVLMGKKL